MDPFKTSESTAKLDEAFAKAQAEFKIAEHDSKNLHFKATFASLAAAWAACRAALGKHQVHVMQFPLESEPGSIRLLTRISHQGEYMQSIFIMPVAKQDPQGLGSALTYAKRYALLACLGLADDDDDGEKAMVPHRKVAAPPAAAPAAIQKPAKMDHVAAIRKVREARGLSQDVVGNYLRMCWPKEDLRSLSTPAAEAIIAFLDCDGITDKDVQKEIEKVKKA